MQLSESEQLIQLENAAVIAQWLSESNAIDARQPEASLAINLLDELQSLPKRFKPNELTLVRDVESRFADIFLEKDPLYHPDIDHSQNVCDEYKCNAENVILFLSRVA